MDGSRTQPTPDDPPVRPEPPTREQFGRWFGECYRLLWTIAAGIVPDRHAAEDIVHDAAVQALGKLDQFEPGTNFPAWMAQIVRYVALNHARKQRRRTSVAAGGEDIAVVPDRPDGVRAQRVHPIDAAGNLIDMQPQFDDDLAAALEALSPTARACTLLRIVEGLDYKDIASLLEIPQGTAMSHVHRSRRHLREKLIALRSTHVTPAGQRSIAQADSGQPS